MTPLICIIILVALLASVRSARLIDMRRFTYLLLLLSVMPAHAAVTLNVRYFGATGDGKTLDTLAIQQAIDKASTEGGTVVVPKGTYLSGSLFVKSGVTLNVERDATIVGSQTIGDYPMMPTRVAGIEMSWPTALVNVYGQHDAAVTGEGTIDGNGKIFWDSYWTLRKGYEPRGISGTAKTAFEVDAFPDVTLDRFHLDHFDLTVDTAGHICDARDWTFQSVLVKTADHSQVAFHNTAGFVGAP